MPAHQRLRPDDRHGLEHRRKPTIQLDEEQAIAVRELDATAHLALQDDQLMPECERTATCPRVPSTSPLIMVCLKAES